MAVIIVDTNVLVTGSGHSDMSVQCQKIVERFVAKLGDTNDRLAVDTKFRILGEYRNNLNPQDLGYVILNLLESQNRLDFTRIEFDENEHAVVPAHCTIHDLDDRKFVAVALAHSAHPLIYNASDDDWIKDETITAQCGVRVSHLCEAELRSRFQSKRVTNR